MAHGGHVLNSCKGMNKKPAQKIERATHTIDATGIAMGRLATRVATILRGKNKATYQPYIDAGDRVVITNVKLMKLTGQKIKQKVYHSYSGYPGGLKTRKIADILAKNPGAALTRSVYQMLPPTRLRTGMMKRLQIQ